jgi:tetratricopeptide (TPR) repeat protein
MLRERPILVDYPKKQQLKRNLSRNFDICRIKYRKQTLTITMVAETNLVVRNVGTQGGCRLEVAGKRLMNNRTRARMDITRSACALLLLVLGIANTFGQGGSTLESIESEISALTAKIDDKSLDAKARGQLLQQIASNLNRAGEIRFERGEYEKATRAFVDADTYLKQYHEVRYGEIKGELKDAEEKLAHFESNTAQINRDLLVNTYRDLVRNAIVDAISEANYFGDTDSHKAYLKRLNELAVESGNLDRQAEYFEKAGQLEFESGNNEIAFQDFNKALELRRKDGKDEYWTIDYIAAAEWYLGDVEKALDNYRQAADLSRKIVAQPIVFKPDASATLKQAIVMERSVQRASLTQTLLNIAQIEAGRGKYGSASEAVKEVENVINQMQTDDAGSDPAIAPILVLSRASARANMTRMRGRLLEARGDETGAIKSYLEAADIFSQLSGGGPSGALAGLKARLALLYSHAGNFDQARANIRETMRIRARLHQESGTTVALMQASRIELADKKTDAALKYASDAKSSALILGLDDLMAEADEVEADAVFAKAGTTNSRMLETAIRGYESAAKTYRQNDSRPFLVRDLGSLGAAYETAARPKDAETAYRQAIDVAESVRTSFSTAEESEAYSNRGDVTDLYRHLVDLLVSQGRAEDALQYATRAQRRDLIDLIPKQEIKLVGKSGEALREVNAAEQREKAALSNLKGSRSGPNGSSAGTQKTLSDAVGAARQDYALAVKRLETEQPNLRFTVRPTDLLKLQASVSPTEAILSYLVTTDRLYIFVVRRSAVAVRSVEISQNDLRVLIAQAREGLKGFGDDFYDISSDADTGFATEKSRADLRIDDNSEHYKKVLLPIKRSLTVLNEKLITPVEDLVGDATTLKIIPNAELFLLPFSALIGAKDNRYLLEKHDLIFLTAGDLITSPAKIMPNGLLVAFGDPTEANLDGALDEVKAIQKVFPRSQLFTEDKATKDQLFKLKTAKILHFATHGHIRNPLESSTIQLARLPNITNPDLSYGEIYALPIEMTDMIVLSACETALGGVSGTEVGVFVEAFRTKTSTVAASLWSVDDFATRELMVEFYTNLAAGQTRAFAMRTAQLKLLHDGRTKNPLFWAAFVLYGDGGRLTGLSATPTSRAVK